MTYPGGKSQSGTPQLLINLMPPHEIYVEPFLGGGAIIKAKRPASQMNIGIDINAEVVAMHSGSHYVVLCEDGINWIETKAGGANMLIYLDPPYLMDTRSSRRHIYKNELAPKGEDDRPIHARILAATKRCDCMVMISGYPSELYNDELTGWRTVTYTAVKRSGELATECVWLNFAEPLELHDYRFLGRNFMERQQIKRQQERWRNRLLNMTSVQRYAMLATINALRYPNNLYNCRRHP